MFNLSTTLLHENKIIAISSYQKFVYYLSL